MRNLKHREDRLTWHDPSTGSPFKGVGEEEDVREDKEDVEDYNQLLELQLLNQLYLLLYCKPLPLHHLSSLNRLKASAISLLCFASFLHQSDKRQSTYSE